MKHRIKPSRTFIIVVALIIVILAGGVTAWYWSVPDRGQPAAESNNP